ncbi:hypothetical protein [uncultured Ruminococcus sp.]|uniref:hypothetical protein n=1 Tax=uncultured Ruminococcus sp. TaxID=165186 RepID=UPI0025EA76F9|nr:hypothetical protein [uncultured Ruminococcus sp.]
MKKKYIDIPLFTTLDEIVNKNYTLSATQYKFFNISNKNIKPLSSFLDRKLERKDLGYEVGSECYVESSPFMFIKTKALQPESYLLDENKESTQYITPHNYVKMDLKQGDLLISKDSNVGEIVILDKDYPNTMLCGGIYRLPITKNKYYLLAFIKSDVFRQQIDFLVPRGSTIRHGKTKFLDCLIPLPNKSSEDTIKYVELLMQAIINKEIEIKKKHNLILCKIQKELELNQSGQKFKYNLPSISEIMNLDRMDSSLYSEDFRRKEFLITNYKYGVSSVKKLGFKISRGQNLQISSIGKSIQTDVYRKNYYTLILPKFLSKYGTVYKKEYLGNPNKLKTLKKGDIIFGAEGNEKGRSLAIIEEQNNTITNIHGITLNQKQHSLTKGIFIKLFLDYYRANGMIDAYAVGGNGGSLAIKYWNFLKFPNFPVKKENQIVKLYHNASSVYKTSNLKLNDFLDYDNKFNQEAGIYELDKSMKYLQEKLSNAINAIVDDIEIKIKF